MIIRQKITVPSEVGVDLARNINFMAYFLLINSHAAIYIYRKLSRDVPVLAQIGTAGSQTNHAGSNKPNAIRKNQGGGVICGES